jgi:hypothetical protein
MDTSITNTLELLPQSPLYFYYASLVHCYNFFTQSAYTVAAIASYYFIQKDWADPPEIPYMDEWLLFFIISLFVINVIGQVGIFLRLYGSKIPKKDLIHSLSMKLSMKSQTLEDTSENSFKAGCIVWGTRLLWFSAWAVFPVILFFNTFYRARGPEGIDDAIRSGLPQMFQVFNVIILYCLYKDLNERQSNKPPSPYKVNFKKLRNIHIKMKKYQGL